jgi:hypothetical protein
MGAPMDAIAEEPSGEDSTSNEGSEHNPAEHADSADNIKLQRVTGVSVRHTKPPPASVMKEGWMVHYTNKSTLVRESLSYWFYVCVHVHAVCWEMLVVVFPMMCIEINVFVAFPAWVIYVHVEMESGNHACLHVQ